MYRRIGNREFFYAIPSVGRPENVPRMHELTGEATWIVRPQEEQAYRDAGAKEILYQTSLTHARNQGLNAAFAHSLPCLQSDDDAKSYGILDAGKRKQIPFQDFVREMFVAQETQATKLAGMLPVNNPFYAKRRVATRGFIIASIFLANPSEIGFDQEFKLKEDYDYTLQHLVAYGSVARCDWLLGDYQHYTNPGGCVETREAAGEQEAVARLKAKWGPVIRDNPRRPNEILLRWDREKYALWKRRQNQGNK